MLGVHAGSATVYHRKKYYSEARKADITVDVSIEVIMAGTERPFLIWIWECKDYSRSVGIDDIQEFDAKLQQIGANNTKGTVITRRGFQRSAIEYAKSRGIGLARLIDEGRVTDVMHSLYAATPMVSAEEEKEERQRYATAVMGEDTQANSSCMAAGITLEGEYVIFEKNASRGATDGLQEYMSQQMSTLLSSLCRRRRAVLSVMNTRLLAKSQYGIELRP